MKRLIRQRVHPKRDIVPMVICEPGKNEDTKTGNFGMGGKNGNGAGRTGEDTGTFHT